MGPRDPDDVTDAARLDLERARAALALGRDAAAERFARRALARAPRDRDALLSLAQALARLARHGEAERVMRDALSLRPDDAHGHYLLGHLLCSTGRVAEAAAEQEVALRLAPEAPQCWSLLALAHAARLRHFEARRCVERALAHAHGAEAEVLDHAARVYLQTGELDLAERYARQSLGAAPEAAYAHALLAKVHARRARPADAADCARRAIELDPNLWEAWADLGLALSAQASLPDAERALREALRLNAASLDCTRKLVEVLLQRGERELARAALAEALPRFQGDPVLLHLEIQARPPPPPPPPPPSPPARRPAVRRGGREVLVVKVRVTTPAPPEPPAPLLRRLRARFAAFAEALRRQLRRRR